MELLKNFLIASLSIGLQLVEISHQQSCASWTANPGFHSFNGVHYPTYSTVAACKDLCVSTPDCVRIDFNSNPDQGCYVHTAPVGLFAQPTITQYTIERTCHQPVNLALGKQAFQSSSYFEFGHPNHAVDGNRAAVYTDLSCSHTDGGILNLLVPAWWAVDLEKIYAVHRVTITSRGDCCSERLRDFHIGLTDIYPTFMPISLLNQVDQGKIIATYSGSPPAGTPTNVSCNCGKTGRFLYVQQTVLEPLTICELEVYGSEPRVLPAIG